ncbi:ATP-binding protein, partial [Thermodesulfobacteriota bacterium]
VKQSTGAERHCLLTSSAWMDDHGTVLAHLSIARDITEAKRLEEQLIRSQKMEAVGTLAGGIAHDFNNLLQVIHGYADLALLDISKGEKGHSELREIKTASRSAAELTQGLLTFSRQVESKLRPVNLNHELKQVVRMLERTIPKMIEIELRPADNLAPVKADSAQLQQVMMNLGVNARDAMPDGGRLVIETQSVELDAEYCKSHLGTEPGNFVVLTVSDNGCGMDKEAMLKIFEPFYTTKEAGKGTGLGLAIVYGIVKNHGGHIICYSEPGKGTSFKIYFPFRELERNESPVHGTTKLVGGNETILLVDDEDAVRNLGEKILTRFGYSVLSASNGREGLEIFNSDRHRISLIILDLIMPEMGGRECLSEILKIDPAARVIIASGYAVNGQMDVALEEGAKASIRKPYMTSQLVETVRETLDAKDTQ